MEYILLYNTLQAKRKL